MAHGLRREKNHLRAVVRCIHVDRIVGGDCDHHDPRNAPAACALEGRDVARFTACKNHLRQMGIALKLYVDDMRGRYPMFGYYTNELLVSYVEWPEALRPYYPIAWTNRDFHCPGYNGVVMTSGSAATANGGTASWGGYAGSYGYNGPGSWNPLFKLQHPPHLGLGEGYLDYDASNPRAIKYPPPISESQLKAPSEMLAFGDSRAGRGPDFFPPTKWFGAETRPWTVGIWDCFQIFYFALPATDGIIISHSATRGLRA